MKPTRVAALAALLAAAASAVPAGAAAQSVLDRTPNLSAGWAGPPSTLHFNVLHRFDAGDAPVRKVGNAPTFFLGWGHGGYALFGVHYATASDLVPDHPNEWEVLGRFAPLSTDVGAPVGLGVTAAWNEAARSFDGELAATIPAGPLDLVVALRGFSDAFGEEDGRWAFGTGAVLDVGELVALAADVVRPFELADGEAFGWGAAVQLAIPYTPHTLSLQAANTNSATLQGSSRRSGGTRWGFELTVPFEPGRYFGEGAGPREDPGARVGEADIVGGDSVRVSVGDDAYGEERLVVRPGTYVVWTNDGQDVHSVTSETRGWESPLMAPGETFGRVFTEAGEHPYRCALHPEVRAVVVVREGGGP